jgi:hypothetical protein
MDIRAAISLVEDASTAISAFDRWFAGSKIVTPDGKPLKLFHGTSKDGDFKSFRLNKNGIWFTTDPALASDYARENESQGSTYDHHTRTYTPKNTASRVIPVYVRATKVVHWNDLPDEMRYAENYKRVQGQMFDKLRWDGVEAVTIGDGLVVVIGHTAQIKSAIGNRTWNPDKKNLHEDGAFDRDQDVVRLYHGTNDILAAEIERFGFQATGGEGTYEFLKDLAGRAVPGTLPYDAALALKQHAQGYRTPHIFFTPDLATATKHARDNARTGGEIGEEVSMILRDTLGIEKPLFAEAKPVVIAVDLPRSWFKDEIKPNQYEVSVQRPQVDADYIVGIRHV